MSEYITGNAPHLGTNHKGWFIGHFLEECSPRHSRDVEIKWGTHPKNETNEGFAANRTAHSLSILISGKFRLIFQVDDRAEEVLLEKPGDFALWNPGVPHNWKAEEDTIILTVRWPSLPKDQE
jgi:hypothetical protein